METLKLSFTDRWDSDYHSALIFEIIVQGMGEGIMQLHEAIILLYIVIFDV